MGNGGAQDPNAEFQRLAIKYKFIYSIAGLIVGVICILTGLALGLAGAVGNSSLSASFLGLSTKLNDAAPGVVVFVVGIFMVLITKFSVKSSLTETTYVPTPMDATDQEKPTSKAHHKIAFGSYSSKGLYGVGDSSAVKKTTKTYSWSANVNTRIK